MASVLPRKVLRQSNKSPQGRELGNWQRSHRPSKRDFRLPPDARERLERTPNDGKDLPPKKQKKRND